MFETYSPGKYLEICFRCKLKRVTTIYLEITLESGFVINITFNFLLCRSKKTLRWIIFQNKILQYEKCLNFSLQFDTSSVKRRLIWENIIVFILQNNWYDWIIAKSAVFCSVPKYNHFSSLHVMYFGTKGHLLASMILSKKLYWGGNGNDM